MMASMEPQVQGPEIVILLFVLLLALASFGLWLWSLIHCVRNRHLNESKYWKK